MAIPKINKISSNEVVLYCPFNVALALVSRAMDCLGKVHGVDMQQQCVVGKVSYGFQSVKVCAILGECAEGSTNVLIQASGDDVWGVGARSAIKRLVETLCNLGNPEYKPDRLGLHPISLAGRLIGCTIFIYFLVTEVLSKL